MALPVRRRRGFPLRRVREPQPFRTLLQDPFREFEEMWERMGRLMEQAVDRGQTPLPWVPVVEVDEREDTYVLRAELPGIRREDVNVDIDERGLAISGETSQQEEQRDMLRRRTGRFSYHTAMPRDADPDRAEATMHEGVLTIRLPRTQRAGRRVEVTDG